jgi:hypothetical protein
MERTSTTSRSAPLISALDALLAATSAFKNLRAIALMGMTLVSAILIGTIFSYLGGGFLSLLGILLAMLVFFYGVSAVGVLLMREAQGQPPCAIADAVMYSLMTSHRLIAVALLELLIALGVSLAILLVFFICKIPGLGAFLFTFAFPAAALVLGVVFFSLFYIIFPLAGPAVWSGSSTFQTIARLNTVVRTRLMPVVIQQFILFVIVMFAAGIVFAIVGLGFAMATGLSGAVLSTGGMEFGDMAMRAYGMGRGSGHMVAGMIGGSVLFAVAAVLPGLIATKGLCIIYLNGTQGLDFAQAEAQLESGMAAVKKKAEEARERARQMAEQAAQQAKPAPAAPPSAAPAADAAAPAAPAAAPAQAEASPVLQCPHCRAPVAASDAFCGECGGKLG